MIQGYRLFCNNKCSNSSEWKKKKIKDTNLRKYGVEYVSQNKKIKEKIRNTNIKKYNVEWTSQNNKIRKKQKETCLKRYKVEYPLQNANIINKAKQTYFEKYNVINPGQSKIIRDKIKQTNLKKYGVENVFQNIEIKDKIRNTLLIKQIEKIEKKLNKLKMQLISKYKSSRDLIKLKCLRCNTIFKTQYFYIQQGHGKCPNCFPKYRSSGEIELLNFIKSIEKSEIITNSKDIISPYELDIYIPNKKIAIEFDGLYWHSELFKDKYYHLKKTELCDKKDIQLIHIFEDEWIYKQDIVKNKLKQILKIDLKEIDINKCEIREKFQNKETKNYLVDLGLFYNKKLISTIKFLKINQNIWEINYFYCNLYSGIFNIINKFLIYFESKYMWFKIIIYIDRRWSNGNNYKKLGFKLDSIINPKRWDIKNKIKKNELKEILMNKKHIVYDCGYFKFIKMNLKGIDNG